MILGRRFKLQTDHQPLLKIFGSKKGIPIHTANRLQRWALTLLGFDFEVEYIATDKFGYADVLSRLINNHEKPEEEYVIAAVSLEEEIDCSLNDTFAKLPVTFEMVRAATAKDKVLQQVIQYIHSGWPFIKSITDPALKAFHSRRESLSTTKGCVMFGDRLIIPANFQQRILKQIHRGHPGIERMKAVARSIVYWPGLAEDIQSSVRRCSICASAAKSPPHSQPQPWPRADGPWKRIHIDYAGPIEGLSYLVVIDSFTKWPEIFQTRSTTTSATIGFLKETFARYGVPDTIVSDNGTQFSSHEFQQFCESFGVIHIRTAPYHPQSNGQAERFVDTLKRSLRKITEGEGVPSNEALQTFLQVYRSTPSAILEGKSPAEVMFGRPMKTILDLLRASTIRKPEPTLTRYKAGSPVYAKVYAKADKWSWKPGMIIEAVGKVMFNVLLDQPRKKLIRSHTDQLRPWYGDIKAIPPAQLPLQILVENFSLTQPPDQQQQTPQQPRSEDDSDDDFHGFSDVESDASFGSADLDDTMRTARQPPYVSTPQQASPRDDDATPRPSRSTNPPRRLADYIRY